MTSVTLAFYCHQHQHMSYFPIWLLFIYVLAVDASKLASTSLTLRKWILCEKKKPHKNPNTRHKSVSKASQYKFSIKEKKKKWKKNKWGLEERERSCKSRCHFCLIKNSFRTKEQNILKKPCKISISEACRKSYWHSPCLLGIKWKKISLAIFFIDCHYYVYMLVFLHCVFWKTTSIFSMAFAEGCWSLHAHIV